MTIQEGSIVAYMQPNISDIEIGEVSGRSKDGWLVKYYIGDTAALTNDEDLFILSDEEIKVFKEMGRKIIDKRGLLEKGKAL